MKPARVAHELAQVEQLDARPASSLLHDSRGHRLLRALLAGDEWTALALAAAVEATPIMRRARKGYRSQGAVHATSRQIGRLRRGELRAPDLALALALESFNVPPASWYEPASSKAPNGAAGGAIVRGGG